MLGGELYVVNQKSLFSSLRAGQADLEHDFFHGILTMCIFNIVVFLSIYEQRLCLEDPFWIFFGE